MYLSAMGLKGLQQKIQPFQSFGRDPHQDYHHSAKLFQLIEIRIFFSRDVMVLMESVVSGHQFTKIRERLADKIEIIRFDPYSK